MSTRYLQSLLRPESVAVIGASDRPQSVGATVIRNMLAGGFGGPVWPVNVRHTVIAGERAYRSVARLPQAPDLAVICTPPATVPGLVTELAERGTHAVIVISAGLERVQMEDGRSAQQAMLDAARPTTLRVLGPNCVGVLVPDIGLNASFAHVNALPGDVAFVSQSGAMTTAMLDWARSNRIGFSHFISLGNAADIDFGDLVDYLASDARTRSILLYMESVTSAREFLSAARTASRNKPVIVVKAGRSSEAARAAASHTGALAGSDYVYDAAFRRAGMLRVNTTRQLFDAAEVLARIRGVRGGRLAIVSNGGGPAIMATDALVEGGGELAQLAAATITRLDAVLPAGWSGANPVDIIGDAPASRYAAALEIVLDDADVDAVLLIHAPTAIVPAAAIARECAPVLARGKRPVVACWMGSDALSQADAIITRAGSPTYATPEEAVNAFLHLVAHHHNQQQLLEAPASIPEDFEPDPGAARAVIERALAAGRELLTEAEAKQVLAAYRIPVAETRVVASVAELEAAGAALGYPLVLKVVSPDISHKSDVGGVVLGIRGAAELRRAGEAIIERVGAAAPHAQITGFAVQPMIERGDAVELIAGIADDEVFGPVILFGRGGTAVEVIADRAVSLPPLNMKLAGELIGRTRVSRLLAGYRNQPPADLQAVQLALVQLSQLAADHPEIVELDINPLLASARGVIALDARVRVAPASTTGTERFSIRPYPKELEEYVGLQGRRILMRPIRPEDRAQHEAFVARNTPADMQARFFRMIRELPPSEMARFTQIDYEREMAFIAEADDEHGNPETLGVARAHADPDNVEAEFAIIVRSDMKGLGLGAALLSKLIDYCRSRGTRRLVGEAYATNERMLHLARDCGFRIVGRHDSVVELMLDLQAEPPADE